ncbi:MAG: hypothetical protein QM777_16340 [Pseudorhodoferax sp.]
MRALPPAVKKEVQARLWKRAEALDWESMTVIERAKQYTVWVSDPEIGGVLAGYMDARKVHPYLKDTLMKPFARANVSDAGRALSALGLSTTAAVVERYERPHGVRLQTRGVVCWGKADDWKLMLMAAHERAFAKAVPIAGVVLLPPLARFVQARAREVVEDAGRKLGIAQVAWHDPHDQLQRQLLIVATGT